MISLIVVGAICLAAGFGIGRVKNAAKIAAAHNELTQIELGIGTELNKLGVSAEVKAIVARLRAKLL